MMKRSASEAAVIDAAATLAAVAGAKPPDPGKVAEFGGRMSRYLRRRKSRRFALNAFCPTGKGGGIDPTCGKGGGSALKPAVKQITGKLKDPKVKQQVEDTLDELRSRYPALAALKPITTVDLRKGEAGGGEYYGDGGTGAPTVMIIYAEGLPLTSPKIEFGEDVLIGSVREAVAHEYGHHLWDGTKPAKRKEWQKLYGEVGVDGWKKVSDYAASHPEEGFSESLAAFTHPSYSGGLPTAAEGYFRKLLGGGGGKENASALPSKATIPELLAEYERLSGNAFCPTGKGGGIDPTCSPGGTGRSGSGTFRDRDEARERFQATSRKGLRESEDDDSAWREVGDDRATLHLPKGRFIDVTLKEKWEGGGTKFDARIDFGVRGRKDTSIGDTLESESIGMLRRVKDAVKSYHDAGFRIEVAPADSRRRELYQKFLSKMGLEMIREGETEVWNVFCPTGKGGGPDPMDDAAVERDGGGGTTNALPSQKASAAALYELSDEYTRAEARDVARAVLAGYANDKSADQVSRVLQKQLGIDKAQADVLATTELTRVAAADALSDARVAAEESGEGKKGKVRFITGTDSCPVCQALHGKVYDLADAQDVIPVHPNCTCRWQAL